MAYYIYEVAPYDNIHVYAVPISVKKFFMLRVEGFIENEQENISS